MDYRSLVNKLEAIERGVVVEAAMPYGNPYTSPEDKAKFELMTDKDQEWLTKPVSDGQGGTRPGAPNINDTIILSRAPDGGKPDPAKVAAKANEPLLAKLKQLMELVDKYMALKAKKQSANTQSQSGRPNKPVKESIQFNGSIANSLVESFGYQLDEAAVVPAPAAGGAMNAVTKLGGAAFKKAMPGVGAYMGATGAYDSYQKGDYLGAALNGLSGAFSLVPGIGWVPALGFGMWQAGRELSGATDKFNKPTDQGAGPAQQGARQSGDPKIAALQTKLKAAGANLGPTGVDGVMGSYTQAAMKQFPNIKESVEMKTVAESMKELQARLAMIESQVEEQQAQAPLPATDEEMKMADMASKVGGHLEKQGARVVVVTKDNVIVEPTTGEVLTKNGDQLTGTGQMFEPSVAEGYDDLEEGFWDSLFKGAAQLSKGAKFGYANPAMAKNLTQASHSLATKGGRLAGRAGAAVARNPVKAGLGAAALGGAAGYLGGSAGSSTTSTPPVTGGGGSGSTQSARPEETEDDAEMKALRAQIDALIKDLSTSQDPAIQKGLTDINTKLGVSQGSRPSTTTTSDDGSKITVGANGQVASTNDDGTPYVPGSNPNLPKNKTA